MGGLAIEATGLEKSYGDVRALRGLDLDVPTGTVLGLLGPNGAGKTTAVRILATLLPMTAGRATVAGHDVLAQPQQVLYAEQEAGAAYPADQNRDFHSDRH